MIFTPKSKLDRFNDAVKVIELFLEGYKSAYKYELAYRTTNNFDTFKKEIAETGVMLVSNEGNSNTIYTHPTYNILARVWHDNVHLKHDLDFSLESEVRTCQHQLEELRIALNNMGVSPIIINDAMELIYHDIIGQATHYADTREFVIEQKLFVFNRFIGA